MTRSLQAGWWSRRWLELGFGFLGEVPYEANGYRRSGGGGGGSADGGDLGPVYIFTCKRKKAVNALK